MDFTPDYVLCLGAGIRSDSSYQVNTSVEQAVLRDGFIVLNKGKWESVKDLKFSCGGFPALFSPSDRIHLCGRRGAYFL